MRYTCFIAFAGFLLSCLTANARKGTDSLRIITSGRSCSIRGMSIPSNDVIWISGSNGQVARSTDAGRSWKWITVPGFEKTDFRDIHAFDSATSLIMGIGNPAYILKTTDGGQHWNTVYSKDRSGMFLDALDFLNDREGICIGDPIGDEAGTVKFFVIRTKDGGSTWQEEASANLPEAREGEAIFSASGTNIALLENNDFDYAFISGGLVSNLYLIGRNGRPGKVISIPINKGKETAGAFSLLTDGRKKFYCIGGDYKSPDTVNGNFAWTKDMGRSWNTPRGTQPFGYRSCVRMIARNRLVACGTKGVDICRNADNWKRISNEGFHVCMVSPNRKMIFFGGEKGKIGLLKL